MEWIDKMNEAIDYIEAHLKEEIDETEVVSIAGSSFYHFNRVFSYLSGVSLSEYIRRRRLTQAAFDLQHTEEKVIDIAYDYGYESPTSFTRAFKKFHNMTPSEARETGNRFTHYPPLTFQITIKGVAKMNYQMKELDAFRIIGKKISTVTTDNQNFLEIPAFWDKTNKEKLDERLIPMNNKEPKGYLGVCVHDENWQETERMDYYIAVASYEEIEEDLVEFEVPAMTWAIFEVIGAMPDAIQQMNERIFKEWLPTSDYEIASGIDIELYTDDDPQSDTCYSEVWLPVKKK